METAEQATVTCLGKTFESEEERREYFRDELRKKLPELKEMDGFPTGDDEDIIELSDPPYYTACPNPWLNDFIEIWEDAKIDLQQNGQRNAKYSVDDPFTYDVSVGRHNPFYLAHTFHTKVPHPAIMRYILHYTQPGDIIIDSYAGTGMTGVAAQKCSNPSDKIKHRIEKDWQNLFKGSPEWGLRFAIDSDLSPIASLIANNYNSISDVKDFVKDVENIIKNIESDFGWVYNTKHSDNKTGEINYVVWSEIFSCTECGNELVFWDVAVDQDGKVSKEFECPSCGTKHTKRKIDKAFETVYDPYLDKSIKQIKTKPVLINYTYGGNDFDKEPDENELKKIEKIRKHKIKRWFPKERMPEGDECRRNDRKGLTHTHHYYHSRTLLLLSALNELCDTNQQKIFFTSQLLNLSKLNRHRPNVTYPYNPLSGTLYISSQVAEANVLTAYKNKISRIKNALKNVDNSQPVSTQSATDVNNLDNSSIDYIFTDPPFGANLMYSELSFLWESWIKVKTNNDKEAIQNKTQNKSLSEYQKIIENSFKEYYRVLKPSRWMTVEFSNTSASVWNSIQTSIQRAGFVIANVSGLDKKENTFKAVTTPTAVKQDLVINCYKPSQKIERKFTDQKDTTIWEFLNEHLGHLKIHSQSDNSTTPIIERSSKILYDRLISFYITRGLPVPIDSKDFQSELKKRYAERDGMYFTQEQVSEYDTKKEKTSNFVQLSLNVSNEKEGIEWLRSELKKKAQSYSEIHPKWMQATTAIRKGDILPELQTILEQNFIQQEDGNWRVPNMDEAKDREALRNKALLKEFEAYVDQATGQGAKKLKEARVEALRAGFQDCWDSKDFKTIVQVGEKLPKNLLQEDDQLLMFYDIATDRV